jgi:hypothetical protein
MELHEKSAVAGHPHFNMPFSVKCIRQPLGSKLLQTSIQFLLEKSGY